MFSTFSSAIKQAFKYYRSYIFSPSILSMWLQIIYQTPNRIIMYHVSSPKILSIVINGLENH